MEAKMLVTAKISPDGFAVFSCVEHQVIEGLLAEVAVNAGQAEVINNKDLNNELSKLQKKIDQNAKKPKKTKPAKPEILK